MAERTHIPSSPACGEWETLLADALDGLLKPEHEAKFTAHKTVCPACATLYEEAREGPRVAGVPFARAGGAEGLLERILAHTGPGHAAPAGWTLGSPLPAAAGTATVPAFIPPVWQQPGFFARLRYGMQPRLLMTAAMAFFSIALTLNLAGVRLTSLRLADLRPQAVRSYMERQLTMASVPIVRYYDHLRFVYEVESRVRELRGKGEGEGNGERSARRRSRRRPCGWPACHSASHSRAPCSVSARAVPSRARRRRRCVATRARRSRRPRYRGRCRTRTPRATRRRPSPPPARPWPAWLGP